MALGNNPYSFGANTYDPQEYNPKGDTANGTSGSYTSGSVRNAATQANPVPAGSGNPFADMLNHVTAFNGAAYGGQSTNTGGAGDVLYPSADTSQQQQNGYNPIMPSFQGRASAPSLPGDVGFGGLTPAGGYRPVGGTLPVQPSPSEPSPTTGSRYFPQEPPNQISYTAPTGDRRRAVAPPDPTQGASAGGQTQPGQETYDSVAAKYNSAAPEYGGAITGQDVADYQKYAMAQAAKYGAAGQGIDFTDWYGATHPNAPPATYKDIGRNGYNTMVYNPDGTQRIPLDDPKSFMNGGSGPSYTGQGRVIPSTPPGATAPPTSGGSLSNFNGPPPPDQTAALPPPQTAPTPPASGSQAVATPAPATATSPDPNAPSPLTAPQGPQSPNDYLALVQKLYGPEFAQQQTDLARQMNGQAALTGDINSGGYGEQFGRNMGSLIANQGAQREQALEAAQNRGVQTYGIDTQKFLGEIDDTTKRLGITTNDQLQRWLNDPNNDTLQKYGIDKNDLLQRYQAQLGLQGQQIGANATVNAAALHAAAEQAAAGASADASKYAAGLNFQLGQGQLGLDTTRANQAFQLGQDQNSITRENNIGNYQNQQFRNAIDLISQMYGVSPDALLSGTQFPTGTTIVKP